MSQLGEVEKSALVDLVPMLRRMIDLDPNALARLRFTTDSATLLARLPFGVLASRTVTAEPVDPSVDVTVSAAEAVAWFDRARSRPPSNRDADWRGGSPPRSGWTRLETVPDEVVRGLVRQGALALKDAAAREGVPGAQPRAEVADALLDSVVLTVDNGCEQTAEVTLRTLSALTRMGFLPRGGTVAVDVSGRWTRVAAGYGTVYAERAGATLSLH